MLRDDPYPDQETALRAQGGLKVLVHGFTLAVVEGPDAGATFTIRGSEPGRVLLGKGEACAMRLTDLEVSRRHAALEVVSHRLRILDLGSTNGTVVDGVTIIEALLSGGELIRIGASESMRRLYPLCERLAQSNVPVVVEGETGVGKELLGEAIHAMSPRCDEPFVVFDCTAVAPNLIESELFGHERGAFTGSVGVHRGVFERAHRGTLFIDEIGDLPLGLQPKLLRAIERLVVTRIGGDRPIQVDVRVIAATRRDLDHEIQAGRFRDDLFHRLAVARVELPPLRERRGDVTLLARHFWAHFGGDAAEVPLELLEAWEDYAWPGNVRELRNAVARRLALGDLGGSAIVRRDPPPGATHSALHAVRGGGDVIAAVLELDLTLADARQRIVAEFEQRYLHRILELHRGNVTRAAAAAGITRRQMQRLKGKIGDDADRDPE